MATMRAKLRVNSVEPYPMDGQPSQERLRFSAVSAKAYPADGSDEDNTFARYTPSASLEMTITNPALLGKFRKGQVFYLDFTEAPAS